MWVCAPLLGSVAQPLRQSHLERLGYPGHDEQTRISLPALDPADLGQVDLGLERQLLLGEPALVAEPANVPPQLGAAILHCRMRPDRAYR